MFRLHMVILLLLVAGYACHDASDDRGQWLDPRMKSCNERGFVWIAVVENGLRPSRCGEAMSEPKCEVDALKAHYPDQADEIGSALQKRQGFELYNCGDVDGFLTLHFASISENQIRYGVEAIEIASPVATPIIEPSEL